MAESITDGLLQARRSAERLPPELREAVRRSGTRATLEGRS